MTSISKKISGIDLNSYKVYQTLGWSIYYFAELTLTFSIGKLSFKGFIITTLSTLFGIGTTSLMRIFYRRMAFKSISIFMILVTAFSISAFVAILHFLAVPLFYFVLDIQIKLVHYFETGYMLRAISYQLPIYFGWSILYFSIKFWLEWEGQRKIAERASVMFQNTQFQLLRYHLNPHFLFNALNSIRALIDEDTVSSRKLITELSEYLRYSLISRNKPSVSLYEELEAVRHYLSVEKQRYEEKISVEFEIDQKSVTLQIPSFIIQPLIENAIKFGMRTSQMPLKILIRTEVTVESTNISVINSGKWIKVQYDEKDSFECGLKNVKERMKNVFNENFNIETFEKDNYVYIILKILSDAGGLKDVKVQNNHR
jgi:two-component system, LytTR family, sensor kinase